MGKQFTRFLSVVTAIVLALCLMTVAFATTEETTMNFAEFNEALKNAKGVYDGNGITVVLKDSERSYYNNKTSQFFVAADDWYGTNAIDTIEVSNVNFVFADDDDTNTQVNGELQVFANNMTFSCCTFNNVSVCPWGTDNGEGACESAVITDCTFTNIEVRYGVHQNRAQNLTVVDCVFEECVRGIHTSSPQVESITIKNNTFTGIGEGYGVLCLAEMGDVGKAKLDIFGNVADGQVFLRQLNAGTKYAQVEAIFANNIYGTEYVDGSIIPAPPVAQVDDTKYETLAAAVEAAQNGETVTLIDDTEEELGIKITDKNLTIDLGGYTYTVTKGDDSTVYRNFLINGTSEVTIKNGTIVSEGSTEGETSSGVWGSVRTEGTAKVTMTGLKLYNYRGNGLNIKAYTGSTVNVSDTEIYAQYGGGVEAAGGTVELTNVKVEQKGLWKAPYNSMAISVNGGGQVTVHSGSYTTEPLAAADAYNQGSSHGSWAVGVLNSGGTLIINGGTFANGNFGEDSLATAARGLILADTAAKVTVNGGTFTALGKVIDIQNNLGDAANNPVVTLKGGDYSADPTKPESNCIVLDEEFQIIENEDGTYTVKELPDVAEIDNVGYKSFEAALAAANGKTVKLLTDIALTETVTIDKGITVTLDLNGKTLSTTSSTAATHVDGFLVKGNLTVKNGTVDGKFTGTNMGWNGGYNVFDVTAGGVLNLQDVTVNAGGTDMNFCVHLNNWGEVTLNAENCTFNSTYCAVRAFNSGSDMNNVTIKNSALTGATRAFWVHNYASADFGGKLYSGSKEAYDVEKVNARLNLDIYDNGNTFTVTGTPVSPIRYGFNEVVYFNESGVPYVTNAALLKAALEAGGEVKLYSDIELSESITVPAGVTVTLDLNGKTITGTDPLADNSFNLLLNRGNLTVTDSVGGGKITLKATTNRAWNYSSSVIGNGAGTLIINGGTLEHLGGTDMAYTIDNNSTLGETKVTVNGGTLISPYRAIRAFQNSTTAQNVIEIKGGKLQARACVWMQQPGKSASLGTLTITGGTFDSYSNAVVVDLCGVGKTDVTISGGEFSNENENANLLLVWPLSDISAVSEGCYAKFTITGGTFNCTGEGKLIGALDGAEDFTTFAVSGGKYSEEISEDYCIADYAVFYDEQSEMYIVKEKPDVAEVDNVIYKSLKDAFAAANGKTVKLLENTELAESITVPAGVTVTLDLNGKTITGTDPLADNSFNLFLNKGALSVTDSVGGGKITLKATTDRNWNYSSSVIGNGAGTLIINGGTLEHLGGTDMAYTIDNNSTLGETKVTVNGGTLISPYRAIRAFQNSTTQQNIIEIKGGKLQARACVWMQQPGKSASLGTLTITGGTFDSYSNAVVVDLCGAGKTDVTISGGKFTNENVNGNLLLVWPLTNMSAVTEECYAKFTITGGDFTCAGEGNLIGALDGADANTTFAVSGGTYSEKIAEEYLAEDYGCYYDEDSKVYRIKVKDCAKIVTQPVSGLVDEGKAFIATVEATGDGLTYQWYWAPAGSDDFRLTTTYTGNEYRLYVNASNDGRQVYCVVTDWYGNSVQSETVTMHYKKLAKIITQPKSAKILSGELFRAEVEAIGDGLTYEWYWANKGSNTFYKTNSFKSNFYQVEMDESRDGRQVYCVITDCYGNSVKSDVAVMNVQQHATIVAQPESGLVDEGKLFYTEVEATGDGLTYAWYWAPAGSDDFRLTTTYTDNFYRINVNAANDGRQVYCVVTDEYGNSVKSDVATMHYKKLAKIVEQPKNGAVYEGETFRTTVEATGDGLTYAWYWANKDSDTFYKTTAFTGATYSIEMDASRDGRQVYCVVTDRYGNKVTSEVVTMTMKNKAAIVTQPEGARVAEGALFRTAVEATGDGLTYQWYYADAGSNSFKATDTYTGSSYVVRMEEARDGRRIYCVVTDEYGNSVKSETVTMTMQKTVKIVTQPEGVKTLMGDVFYTEVEATGDGLTYEWFWANAGSTKFYKTTAFTGNFYEVTMNASRAGRQIYCVITDAYGNSVKTDVVTLEAGNPVKIVTQPKSASVAKGGRFTTTVEATGDGLTYAWYWAPAGSDDFTLTTTYTTNTYSIPMTASRDGRQVYCVVSDEYGNSVTTNIAVMTLAN